MRTGAAQSSVTWISADRTFRLVLKQSLRLVRALQLPLNRLEARLIAQGIEERIALSLLRQVHLAQEVHIAGIVP